MQKFIEYFIKFFLLFSILVFLFLIDISFIHEGPFVYLKNISLSLIFILFLKDSREYKNIFALLFGILIDWNNRGFLGLSSFFLVLILVLFSFSDKFFSNKFPYVLFKDISFFFFSALFFFNFLIDKIFDVALFGIIFCVVKNVIKYLTKL